MGGVYKPEIQGASTICLGTSIEQTINTNSDYTVSWSHQQVREGETSPSSFIPLFASSTFPYPVTLNASIESGKYVLRAEVTNNYTGCSTIIYKTIKIGKIPVANIEIETPVDIDVQNLCPSLPLFLHGNLLEINGVDWSQVLEVEWTNSNPFFRIMPTPIPATGNRRATVFPSSVPYDFTFIKFRVRNECGWSEQVIQLRNGEYTTETCLGGVGREMVIYPNPTKSDIKVIFKVDCQDCTQEELEKLYPKIDENTIVTLTDGFGNIRLNYIGKQIQLDINKNIHLQLATFPVGNYVLKVITKEEVFFAHVIKE